MSLSSTKADVMPFAVLVGISLITLPFSNSHASVPSVLHAAPWPMGLLLSKQLTNVRLPSRGIYAKLPSFIPALKSP